MNLYLYSATCAFFLRHTVLCCFLRTDLRVKFHTAPRHESSIKWALCTELNRQWREWELGSVPDFWSPLYPLSVEHTLNFISSCDQSGTFTLVQHWGLVAAELLCEQGTSRAPWLHAGSLLPSWWNHLNFNSGKGSAHISLTNFHKSKFNMAKHKEKEESEIFWPARVWDPLVLGRDWHCFSCARSLQTYVVFLKPFPGNPRGQACTAACWVQGERQPWQSAAWCQWLCSRILFAS